MAASGSRGADAVTARRKEPTETIYSKYHPDKAGRGLRRTLRVNHARRIRGKGRFGGSIKAGRLLEHVFLHPLSG